MIIGIFSGADCRYRVKVITDNMGDFRAFGGWGGRGFRGSSIYCSYNANLFTIGSSCRCNIRKTILIKNRISTDNLDVI